MGAWCGDACGCARARMSGTEFNRCLLEGPPFSEPSGDSASGGVAVQPVQRMGGQWSVCRRLEMWLRVR